MLDQVLLRDHRHTISMGFLTPLVPMHAMMVAIFLCLYSILVTMAGGIAEKMALLGEVGVALKTSQGASIAGEMGGNMFFSNFDTDAIGFYVIIIISMLTISNVLAGIIISSGDNALVYFYTRLICSVLGLLYIVVPIITGIFFMTHAFEGV